MIVLLTFFAFADLSVHVDSLQEELKHKITIATIERLNRCYVQQNQYRQAITMLQEYEQKLSWHDQAILHVLIGDNLLYTGSLLAAREKYLMVVSRYTKSPAANDALERIYLLESVRSDTIALKRLSYALSRLYAQQWKPAQDSLKQLLNTAVGVQAYYYLALSYKEIGDIPLALGMLNSLEQDYPAHGMLGVPLLRAQLFIHAQRPDEARTVLEDFIIQHPRSIYTVKARALLKTIQ